ncbi:MAG: hypothetical protein ABJH07_25525 [Sedimentitalea sp.]|uniref:hypothetical protein n=1 Tax=Sedimentitalea sp. TaxID=2048915 RepID=UPI0032677156
MGFPFEPATWDGVSGPIFMGYGSVMPGVFTVISIGLCIAALVIGQRAEAAKYSKYK